jgi:hypothetical protein
MGNGGLYWSEVLRKVATEGQSPLRDSAHLERGCARWFEPASHAPRHLWAQPCRAEHGQTLTCRDTLIAAHGCFISPSYEWPRLPFELNLVTKPLSGHQRSFQTHLAVLEVVYMIKRFHGVSVIGSTPGCAVEFFVYQPAYGALSH